MIKQTLSSILILSFVLPFVGCGNKTTLDRVGAVLVTAATIYGNELDQLKAQGLVTGEKYDVLKQRADAIKAKAEAFRLSIAAFAEIRANDIPGILNQVGAIVGLVDATLTDPDIAKLTEQSRAVRALRYLRATLDAVSVAVSALFPPPATEPSVSTSQIAIIPARKTNSVVIQLPAKPKL